MTYTVLVVLTLPEMQLHYTSLLTFHFFTTTMCTYGENINIELLYKTGMRRCYSKLNS